MTLTNKPSKAFWIIAVIALLWNLMGVFQFLSSTLMAEELRKTLTEAQIALLDSMPGWYDIAFGIGVFAGLLGCILLLMRKKMAIVLFALSLLAVFIYMGYWVIGTDATKVYGMEAIVMPLVVIAGCIFLYFYSKGAARNGWLT